jgi:hypothetical protein
MSSAGWAYGLGSKKKSASQKSVSKSFAHLFPLLGPDTAAAGEDPSSPETASHVTGVVRPAHDGGVAVGGQCDGLALVGVSNRVVGDQLAALLGPDPAAAGVDPRCPAKPIVVRPAHDGGVAVSGQ